MASGICRVIKFWDVATGREQTGLWSDLQNSRQVAYSADGQITVAIQYDDIVKIGDVSTRGGQTVALGTFQTICSAFSPDGPSLALGDLDGTVRVWDLNRLVNTETKGDAKGDGTNFYQNR